jgi:hypothetical protein
VRSKSERCFDDNAGSKGARKPRAENLLCAASEASASIGVRMRRGFSIFLILFFGLGSLSVFIDSEDANLPACCRRHGAHHCAMDTRVAAVMRDAASGKMPMAGAPMTCPQYPGLAALLSPPTPALTVSVIDHPTLLQQVRVVLAEQAAPTTTDASAHAGRGPPQTLFS